MNDIYRETCDECEKSVLTSKWGVNNGEDEIFLTFCECCEMRLCISCFKADWCRNQGQTTQKAKSFKFGAFALVLNLSLMSLLPVYADPIRLEGRYQLFTAEVGSYVKGNDKEAHVEGSLKENKLFKIDTVTGDVWFYCEYHVDGRDDWFWKKIDSHLIVNKK